VCTGKEPDGNVCFLLDEYPYLCDIDPVFGLAAKIVEDKGKPQLISDIRKL
jgi:hypothetical protein